MTRTIVVVSLLLLFVVLLAVDGFQPVAFRRKSNALTILNVLAEQEMIDPATLFDSYETLDFVLLQHKPLGCTVEESLADTNALPIFVTKIIEGSFADKAGLKVGDVMVAVSGIFGDLSPSIGIGLDAVKKLVASTPKEDPLYLRIARGTTVMADHETALVNLCIQPDGGNDKEIEQCMLSYLTESYMDDSDNIPANANCDDGETECLLDDMWADWNEELPEIPSTSIPEEDSPKVEAKRPAPWSSRSSPSGTWVRDPATGEMRNIDG